MYSCKGRRSTGFSDFTTVHNRGKIAVVAGDTDGYLRLWNMKIAKQPEWCVKNGDGCAINCILSCKQDALIVTGTERGNIIVRIFCCRI